MSGWWSSCSDQTSVSRPASASAALYTLELRPCENDKLKSPACNRKKPRQHCAFQKPTSPRPRRLACKPLTQRPLRSHGLLKDLRTIRSLNAEHSPKKQPANCKQQVEAPQTRSLDIFPSPLSFRGVARDILGPSASKSIRRLGIGG